MLRWTSRALRRASLWRPPTTPSRSARGALSLSHPLSATTCRFQVVLSPKNPQAGACQHVAATLQLPSRFYSQAATSNTLSRPAMSLEDRALARDYRERLESAPNDAVLARLVFEDIREGGGTALSQFVASNVFCTLAREGSVDESREQYKTVLRVWDAIRRDGGEVEPSFHIPALLAAANLEQNEHVFWILEFMKAADVDAAKAYGIGDDTALVYRTAIGWAVKNGENGFWIQELHRVLAQKSFVRRGSKRVRVNEKFWTHLRRRNVRGHRKSGDSLEEA
ncbi:hypothetical protein ON010_g9643 [Phytophthora cinnamomi]|nr:hypothetical protein ON010_g9643 [Phytophthora cinnamomi]